MTAIAFRVGRWLRSRIRPTAVVAFFVTVVAALVLATAMGARRTSTAPDRYADSRSDALDASATQFGGRPLTADIARLPGVRSVEAATFVFGTMTRPGTTEPLESAVFSGSVVPTGARIVAGRGPNPNSPGEFVISRDFATASHLSIGDRVHVATMTQTDADTFGFDPSHASGPTTDGVLVGLIDGPGSLDDPTPVAVFSTSLLRDENVGISATIVAIGLRDGMSLAELRTELDTLPGGSSISLQPAVVVSSSIRTAVRGQSVGLWILCGLGALAAVVALGQLLARLVRLSPDEATSLGSLGYSRAQLLGESAVRAAAIVTVSVVVAAGLAFSVSNVFPFGFARRVEPHPGISANAPLLALGAAVLIVGMVGWVVLTTRPRTARPATRPPGVVDALASRCPGSAMGVGLRFAVTSHSRDSGSPRVNVVGLATIAAAVVGTLTFGLSVSRLVDQPARYGVNYDFMADNGATEVPAQLVTVLRTDPDIEALTLYTSTQVRVGTTTLDVAGPQSVRGVLDPVVLTGRLPVRADEAAIGRVSARELGVSVGDEMEVSNDSGTTRFHITGLVIPPGIGGNDVVGHGLVVTHDALALLDPAAVPNAAVFSVRADAPAGTDERVARAAGISDTATPTRPPAIRNVARITFVPYALAGLLALLATMTLVNVVYTSVRRRNHQTAIFRALGADRRWLLSEEIWQAMALSLLPAVIGAPAGYIAGRYVFRLFADRIGTMDGAAMPVAFAGVALGIIVVLGLLAGAMSGHRNRRVAPSLLLRAG